MSDEKRQDKKVCITKIDNGYIVAVEPPYYSIFVKTLEEAIEIVKKELS